ncbi:MAG: hypothetical protein M1829_001311 [Trizodia sp. TS-e1964]|nr:MAG: hypothetical protein M1829_001311 [Trizodia sp. TS-e1964]
MTPLAVGDHVESLSTFEDVLRELSVKENFDLKVHKSDKTRVILTCRSSDSCPFRARCNWFPDQDKAILTSLHSEHTCLENAPVKQIYTSLMAWLIVKVPKLLTVTSQTSTKDIMDLVKKQHDHTIELQQAQKVKVALLNNNLAVHANDFQKLPAYLDALVAANKGVYTKLLIKDDEKIFYRIFICLS